MSVIGSNILAGASGAGAAYTIDQSLRFEDGSSAYLSRTQDSGDSSTILTISFWFKRGNINAAEQVFNSSGSGGQFFIRFNSSEKLVFRTKQGGTEREAVTSRVFRDPSAWYHIVAAYDVTQGTDTNRLKVWVNGVQETLTGVLPIQTTSMDAVSDGSNQAIGRLAHAAAGYFDGYLSEYHQLDGVAKSASDFGEVDETYGHWKPIRYTGTYGTNGFYLPFSGTFYNDASGNGNNWTANNLATTDVVLDSPTNNFATLNPLDNDSMTLSEGNLEGISPANAHNGVGCTMGAIGGKWYYEVVANATPSFHFFGWAKSSFQFISQYTSDAYSFSDLWAFKMGDGDKSNGDGDNNTYGSGFASGDVMMIAADLDNGKIYAGKNGTWFNSGDPVAGTNAAYTNVPTDEHMQPFYGNSTSGVSHTLNFGQDSSFAGNKTAQGNTDDNGYGDFYYSPPSGFLALCTANLSDPAVVPGEHFNTVLYSGTGSSNSVTGVGFQPDFVWVKGRSVATSPNVYDAVRGAQQRIKSDGTDAEDTRSNGLTSFDANGFTVVSDSGVNGSGSTFVAWNWKADNTAGSSNTDGSITSTVAANVDAGFSIVSFTGTGATATVGHGLGITPEFYIIKSRSTGYWWTYTTVIDGSLDYFQLNDTYAKTDSGLTVPTSSVFSVNSSVAPNTENIIAYAFHSVDGYSKFGSYTGNGSTDGPFVYTGFRPSFVILKRTDSTGNWNMYDNKRDPDNAVEHLLYSNLSNSEDSWPTGTGLDFTSNGFKIRRAELDHNASGGTYIYMAFAETDFKFSNAR